MCPEEESTFADTNEMNPYTILIILVYFRQIIHILAYLNLKPMKQSLLKFFIVIIALLTLNISLKAQDLQDLIVLRNGQYIECTVSTITDDFIYYKRVNSEDKISVDLVKTILYGDGSEKVIYQEPVVEKAQYTSAQQKQSVASTPAGTKGTMQTAPPTGHKTNNGKTTQITPQYASIRPYNPAFCGIMSLVIPGGGMFVLDENDKAWTYFGTSIGLAALTGIFSGLAITASDYETYTTMSVLSGVSATALLTVDIVSIVDAVKTAKRKNRMYNDIWEKRK